MSLLLVYGRSFCFVTAMNQKSSGACKTSSFLHWTKSSTILALLSPWGSTWCVWLCAFSFFVVGQQPGLEGEASKLMTAYTVSCTNKFSNLCAFNTGGFLPWRSKNHKVAPMLETKRRPTSLLNKSIWNCQKRCHVKARLLLTSCGLSCFKFFL